MKASLQGSGADRRIFHYDLYPIDFMTGFDPAAVASYQPPLFKRFIRLLPKHSHIIDVGCGTGRALFYLQNHGMEAFGLDRSFNSLRTINRRASFPLICSDNLRLPLSDESFEAVVSEGVIHHTADPQKAFKENLRILKRGGYLYLSVYRRGSRHFFLYHSLGKILRILDRKKLGHFLIQMTFLPLYYLFHLLKTRGQRSWRGAKNFFFDYFVTPVCFFYTKEEIMAWVSEANLSLIEYHRYLNSHFFILKKQ